MNVILKDVSRTDGPYLLMKMQEKALSDGFTVKNYRKKGILLESPDKKDRHIIIFKDGQIEERKTLQTITAREISITKIKDMKEREQKIKAYRETYPGKDGTRAYIATNIAKEYEEMQRQTTEKYCKSYATDPEREGDIFVDTNVGSMPVEDYRDIVASQMGFDSYEELYEQGYRIGNGYDKESLTKGSENIRVEGHTGTWYVIDNEIINGKALFLLESEQHGDEAASLIVDEIGTLVLEDVYNGFDDYRDFIASVDTHDKIQKNNIDRERFILNKVDSGSKGMEM